MCLSTIQVRIEDLRLGASAGVALLRGGLCGRRAPGNAEQRRDHELTPAKTRGHAAAMTPRNARRRWARGRERSTSSPPCSIAILREIARPRPVPGGLRRDVRLEDLLALVLGDALAVIVDGDRDDVAAAIARPADHDVPGVLPASWPAWIPFSTRFASTRLSSSLSARTVTGSAGGVEREPRGDRRIELELLDHVGERDRRGLDLGQRAERAERVDEPAQRRDLFLDDLARVGEQLLEPRVVALVRRHALLHRELDRRQRILDLVREAARDVLPDAHALQVLDLPPRLVEVVEHRVERDRRARPSRRCRASSARAS